jgi:phosphopantetheine adenylyltransferase
MNAQPIHVQDVLGLPLALSFGFWVEGFDGLIVNFAEQHGASVIVRGLRTTDNVSNELAMAVINRRINPRLHVLFLPAAEDRDHISSTVVREMSPMEATFQRSCIPPQHHECRRDDSTPEAA